VIRKTDALHSTSAEQSILRRQVAPESESAIRAPRAHVRLSRNSRPSIAERAKCRRPPSCSFPRTHIHGSLSSSTLDGCSSDGTCTA
jgi:hypothetical protein